MNSELHSWWEVLKNRKFSVLLFIILGVLLTTLFLLLFWENRVLEYQKAQFNSSLELIAELDSDLSEEQGQFIRQEIEDLEMVDLVQYWSPEKSAQYVDDRVLSGYSSFLKKNRLDIPFAALLRISLKDLGAKEDVEKVLLEKYQGRLSLVDSSSLSNEQSFAGSFIESISRSALLLKFFMSAVFVILLLLQIYFKMTLFFERSKSFHLFQILHFSSPYAFWPALFVSILISFLVAILGLLAAYYFVGEFLWLLSAMILLGFLLLDLILVWVGRYIAR